MIATNAERERDRDDHDEDRWDDDEDRRDDDDDRRRDGNDYRRVSSRRGDERSRRQERGNGPSFYRSGSGHPVSAGTGAVSAAGTGAAARRSAGRTAAGKTSSSAFREATGERRSIGAASATCSATSSSGASIHGAVSLSRSTDYAGRWLTAGSSRELWISAGGVAPRSFVEALFLRARFATFPLLVPPHAHQG